MIRKDREWAVPVKQWMPFDAMSWCERSLGPEGHGRKYGVNTSGTTSGEFRFKDENTALMFALKFG